MRVATRPLALGGRRGVVLLVGHVLAPDHRAAVFAVLLHADVDHEAVRRSPVPVVLAGQPEDAVAGADDLDGAAFALAKTNAFGGEDCLAVRVGVPVVSAPRGEVRTHG